MRTAASRIPSTVAAFGFAGLVPPIACAAGLFLLPEGGPRQFAWVCLIYYGALIFSFLGGAWWAFAAVRPRPRWIALAVSPSLLALVLLMMTLGPVTRPWAAGLLALAILLSPLADQALSVAGFTPRWWMRLRVPLSIGLAACVALAAWRAPLG